VAFRKLSGCDETRLSFDWKGKTIVIQLEKTWMRSCVPKAFGSVDAMEKRWGDEEKTWMRSCDGGVEAMKKRAGERASRKLSG